MKSLMKGGGKRRRRRGRKGWRGERAGGGQGDSSILPDYRTCPLPLTLPAPQGGKQPLALLMPPPSVSGGAQTCLMGQRE